MSQKTVCDVCGKELGNIQKDWFKLSSIYKEMDYGLETSNTYDLCSKECLLNKIELISERKARSHMQGL